ncbi:CocE/NonD family hydrolase, partial [Acinetobacter baumannii]
VIAGTGPWTRGGFSAIRQRLLESGIAALQYDKRGVGSSTGTFEDTIPVMERDVAAAVAFLRARPDIDPRRIALLGLSQG